MPNTFDLLILPLARSVGQDLPSIPGLWAATPPRRPARGRDRDQLLLFLNLAGGAPLETAQREQLLNNLALSYYRTPGTVTTAQRNAANSLNHYLLDRNLRNAGSGSQAVGMLAQVVLRGERLSLALSGMVHAIVFSGGEAKDIYDPQLAGRGLGLTRMTVLRYFQIDLQANDVLVLAFEIPPSWTPDVFLSAQGQGPESLRRRLLGQAGPDINAALLHSQPGSGVLRLLRPVRPARIRPDPLGAQPGVGVQPSATAQPAASTQASLAAARPPVSETTTAHPEPEITLEAPPATQAVEAEPQTTDFPADSIEGIPPARSLQPNASGAPSPTESSSAELAWPPATRTPSTAPPTLEPKQDRSAVARQQEPAQPKPKPVVYTPLRSTATPILSTLAAVGKAFNDASNQLLRMAATLLRRMLPDEGLFTLPTSTMAFVAIAVPLLMVVVGSVVYFQRGRAAQFQVYFAQAQETALQAQANPDPDQSRQSWETTLTYLDQAEFYQRTPDSQALRIQAQTSVDEIDSTDRLNFQLVIVDGLGENALITRMAATDSDLYLLDGRSGAVLRATLTNSGYRLDPTFECRPGTYAGMLVGTIVDITPLPKGNDLKAVLLGVDANGSLLNCIPGEPPLAASLTPPDTGWGPPQGLTFNTDDLYILDPLMNAVWIYRRMEISSQPRLFFGEQVPPMQDVIDMAVNLDDLYLLHTDGHLTTCVFSGLLESPTRCEDPANYTDQRPGRVSGPLIEDGHFTEILFIPPPDPSIYMLEPNTHAIYHFSVRLTFQRQFRPQTSLGKTPATAFAISRGNRTAFLAIGNQVYAAMLP